MFSSIAGGGGHGFDLHLSRCAALENSWRRRLPCRLAEMLWCLVSFYSDRCGTGDGQMRSSIREAGVPGLVAGLSIVAEGLLCWQLDGVFALLAATVCSGGCVRGLPSGCMVADGVRCEGGTKHWQRGSRRRVTAMSRGHEHRAPGSHATIAAGKSRPAHGVPPFGSDCRISIRSLELTADGYVLLLSTEHGSLDILPTQ
jgi:hypothetical protein